MKKFFEDNILKIVGFTPFFIIGIGYLILNLYLSRFSLSDFNIFQAKSFLTGALFISFLVMLVIVMLLWMNLKDINENSIIRIILNAILKPILLTNTIFFFLRIQYFELSFYNFQNFRIPSHKILAFCSTPLMLSMIFFMFWPLRNDNNQKKIPEWYIVFLVSIIIIPLNLFAFYILYGQDQMYKEISRFIISISFLVFVSLIMIKAIEKDNKKNIDTRYTSHFTGKKEKLLVDGILVFVIFLFSFFLITITYSSYVYPYIPSSIGGGKDKTTIIINKTGEKFIGEIILKTDNRLFLKITSDDIILLNYNDIDRIGNDSTSFSDISKMVKQKTDSITNSKKRY